MHELIVDAPTFMQCSTKVIFYKDCGTTAQKIDVADCDCKIKGQVVLF